MIAYDCCEKSPTFFQTKAVGTITQVIVLHSISKQAAIQHADLPSTATNSNSSRPDWSSRTRSAAATANDAGGTAESWSGAGTDPDAAHAIRAAATRDAARPRNDVPSATATATAAIPAAAIPATTTTASSAAATAAVSAAAPRAQWRMAER